MVKEKSKAYEMKAWYKILVQRCFAKSMIILLSLSFGNDLFAQTGKKEAALLQITKQFKKSLVEKDSILFMSLFLHDSIPWMGITSTKSWAYHKERYPGVKQIDKGDCRGFIRYVVSYPGRIEEKLFNIVIQVDEVMATLTFDYSFWKDQLPFNWGKESWVLLKTNGQWKIAAVYYSGFNQTVEPTPQHLL